jgi:DNA-binding transcriptional MerR regulator
VSGTRREGAEAGRAHSHSRPVALTPAPAPEAGLPESPPTNGAPRYRIGEAARLVGVSASALRLWERQGLVRPERSASGYRTYGDEDVARLRQVQSMRSERVNAPGIRRLLPSPPGAADPQGEGRMEGERLRRLRRGRGLSLRAAAERTGLSMSFISAVERNASGASVATLQRLMSAYGSTMLELFRPVPAGRLVRPRQRPTLRVGGQGVRIEQLAADLRQLEPQLFILAPGSSSDGAYAHAGEEFIYVLAGRCTVWVGADERYRLTEGDALSFPSTLPHRWRNDASGETRLLWINTPPTF